MIKNPFRTRYKVIVNAYGDYVVRYRFWFTPFWSEFVGTYTTLEEAKQRISREKQITVWEE
jgi:hypothetical protein